METRLEVINSIGKITFFLMLLLSVFLLTVRSQKRTSNYLFAVLLIITAFDISGFFLGPFFEKHYHINAFKTAASLLQMPLYYFYVLTICYSDFKLDTKYLWHGILFFTFWVLFIITSYSIDILLVYGVVSQIQWIVYTIVIFLILIRYKKVRQENYSQPISKIYYWLFNFTVFLAVAHCFVLARWVQLFFNMESNVIYSSIIISFNSLVITAWVVLSALYQPQIFSDIKSNQYPLGSFKVQKELVRESNERFKLIAEILKGHMEREKPYLDYELTLEKLASQVEVPEKELSLTINHFLNTHFFDFINQYRINEAKSILSDLKRKDETVLEILYTVGFNSKSSFYTAFKKSTGQTPKNFRKNQLSPN